MALTRTPSRYSSVNPTKEVRRAEMLKRQQNKLKSEEPWKYCKNIMGDQAKSLNALIEWTEKSDDNKQELKEGNLRGVFGENPLHVSILYGNTNIAKWLIYNFPELLYQKYETPQTNPFEEYEGETVLHLIIAKDDWDLFNWIYPAKNPQKEKEEEEAEKAKENEKKDDDDEDKENKDDDDDGDENKEEEEEEEEEEKEVKTEENTFKIDRPNFDEKRLEELIDKGVVMGRFFRRMVDYGDHALTFCVVLERKKMFRRLLDYGADIDVVPERNGDTIFHYCAKMNLHKMFHYVTTACKACGKLNVNTIRQAVEIRNNEKYTCFQYAVKHKHKEIFDEILKYKERRIWKYGTVEFIACPLSELDTHGDNKNSVLEVIVADNALEFVQLPVIKAILKDKWESYAKTYFYTWCVLHILFVIVLFIFYSFYEEEKNFVWLILVLTGLKLIVTEYQRISELHDLIKEHGRTKGMDIFFQWNLEEFSIIEFFHALLLISNICIICIWVSLLVGSRSFERVFMTLSIICECFYTIYFCLTSESIGTLVISTLRIIMGDVRRFFILFGVVAAGFACAIVLLCEGKIKFNRAIITLFYILVGEGDYWIESDDCSGCDELSSWQQTMNELIYFTFLLISSVLLFNLLIAIFSETLMGITENSKENWQYLRASIILSIERKVDDWCFQKLLYHRTGELGEEYGFNDQTNERKDDDDLHYIVFKHNLVTNELETPEKESTTAKKMKEVGEQIKKTMSLVPMNTNNSPQNDDDDNKTDTKEKKFKD